VQLPLFNKPGSSGSDSSSELANNGTAGSEELLNDRFQKKIIINLWQFFLYMESNLLLLLLFLPAFRFASRPLHPIAIGSGLVGPFCNKIIGWVFKYE